MGKRDPRVDAYIANSAEFARPILGRLRELVHGTCPEAEEKMKWGFPHFDYLGMMCSMASFKAHCAFTFWKGELVLGEGGTKAGAMGQFGRIEKLADLPPKRVLEGYIRKAMALNEAGVKATRQSAKEPKPEAEIPPELAAALKKSAKARATFQGFAPGQRREYAEWIADAKRPETRDRRVQTAIEWLAEGKTRNWKYAKKG